MHAFCDFLANLERGTGSNERKQTSYGHIFGHTDAHGVEGNVGLKIALTLLELNAGRGKEVTTRLWIYSALSPCV